MNITVGQALNEQQKQVVENTRDHILLLAGAGTGKTSTLAHRVSHLLSCGAAAREILCLTFTNRACREMLERIGTMADAKGQDVTVRTIHSFCVYLLRNTPQSLVDIGRDFTVCDQPDALEIIREVVFEVTGRIIEEHPAMILQNFIALVKDCQLGCPENGSNEAAAYVFVHRRTELERICVNGQHQFDVKFYRFLAKYGASIVRLYNLKLTSNNTLDFSDLLLRANAVLSNPETASVWNSRYQYVHIDEVQDVSFAEFSLITKLCGNAVVLLCGDFNQTIYQWRGSDPAALIRHFQEQFHPQVIEFTTNYRSSGQLLDIARNYLFNAFQKGTHSGFDPRGGDCTDVCIRDFETLPDEVHWIYRQIESLQITDFSRVAIITRTNRACTEVCEILKASRIDAAASIRFMLADEFRLFKRAEVKDLLACVNLIANPRDGESLKRVLSRLIKGVGASTVDAVISRYKDGLGTALTDFIDPRTQAHGDYFAPLLDALANGRACVFDVESTGTDVYSDDIIQMAAVKLDAHGHVTERFERFLCPSKPVGDSERVHGFSDAFLSDKGVEPLKALEEFLDFTAGCVIIGHNVGFDMTITAQNLARYGSGRKFDNLWYDTLDLSRRFLKHLENHKLCTVAAELGTQNDPSHDAMDDILATADVLTILTERFLRPQTELRCTRYAKYLPRFAQASSLLARLRREAEPLGADALITLLIDTFQLRERYADDPQKLANLLLFSDFASDFCDAQKPLAQQLAQLLELTALSASELDRMGRSTNKVAVITAHQAKGCEFDYVFLPVLQEGVFPTFQAVRTNDVSEEKRVFYVSLTRAKKKLFLSWSHYATNQYSAKPTRFLEMLY